MNRKVFPIWSERAVEAMLYSFEDDGTREMLEAQWRGEYERGTVINDTFRVLAVDGSTVVFELIEVDGIYVLEGGKVHTITEYFEGNVTRYLHNPTFNTGRKLYTVVTDPPASKF